MSAAGGLLNIRITWKSGLMGERNDYCPNFTAWLVNRENTQETYYARARCKMWSCDHCAERNRIEWRYRTMKTVEMHPEVQWSFITLTAHQKMRASHASLYNLRDGWAKFRDKLKYKNGGAFLYFRVFELHEKSRITGERAFHLHALCGLQFDDIRVVYCRDGKRKYEYSRWVKDTAPTCGLGYMVSTSNLEKKGLWGIANYVTKYMTKEAVGQYPKKLRRFQTSHGFAKKDRPESRWEMQGGFYYRDAVADWNAGREIIDIQTGTTVEAMHFATLPDTGIINQGDAPYRLLDE